MFFQPKPSGDYRNVQNNPLGTAIRLFRYVSANGLAEHGWRNINLRRVLPTWIVSDAVESTERATSAVLGFFYFLFLRFLMLTVDLRLVNEPDRAVLESGNIYFVCWHSNVIACTLALQKMFSSTKKPVTIVCADNFGGRVAKGAFRFFSEFESTVLELDRITKSFKKILSIFHENRCIAMTADGPTGPGYSIRKGSLAMIRRHPSILTSVKYSASVRIFWRWDKLTIPLPFSSATLTFSGPATVDNDDLIKCALTP